MQIDVGILISMLSVALAVGTVFLGRTSAASEKGSADGEMKADVKYIKSSVEKQEKKLDKQRALAVSGG